jgi:hypothetical protein
MDERRIEESCFAGMKVGTNSIKPENTLYACAETAAETFLELVGGIVSGNRAAVSGAMNGIVREAK